MPLPTLIPCAVLFGAAERTLPKLSPDGTRLAFLAPVDGTPTLWVGDVRGVEAKPVLEGARPLWTYAWTEDGRYLLFPQDEGGNEDYHLMRLDPATGDLVDLTPFDGVRADVVALRPEVPDEVLVALNLNDRARQDIYRISVSTGQLRQVMSAAAGLVGPVADRRLQVRGAYRWRDDGGIDVVARDGDDSDWRVLASWDPGEAGAPCRPVGVSPDEGGLYVLTAAGASASRLVELDIVDGSLRRVVAEDPEFDLGLPHLEPVTGAPQWVAVERDRPATVVVERAFAELFDSLRRDLGGEPEVISRDAADEQWVVQVRRDTGPTVFHLLDRLSGRTELLFPDRPALQDHQLAAHQPFTFTARDGRRIAGYLSFPPGLEREDLPVVLWVHGGPQHRDVWGFNPFVQLYANRGYLAVEVNYRGSTGYGVDHLEAGNREWGAAMSTDLLDAVAHLVAQGWADAQRIGVTGGSYGGYAALAGVAFSPQAYRCAVDIVGPSNLLTLLRSFPAYWKPFLASWFRRVGHPDADADFLWSRSPLSRAEDIRRPVLVIHGANDPRVTQAESDQIVEALQRNGVPHRYLVVEGEGHGFSHPSNWIRYMGEVEQFLAEHLGGRAEVSGG
jgi:dipeptidyl aminopeptidase/acylaminoacyl peptidase